MKLKPAKLHLALKLLDWHSGQSSGLYAVGSVMLSCAERGLPYDPKEQRGHVDIALPKAIKELKTIKETANFPECVSKRDIQIANNLAAKLEKILINSKDYE